MPWACPYCRTASPDTNQFCTACGAQRRQDRLALLLLLLGLAVVGAVVVLGIGIGILLNSSSRPALEITWDSLGPGQARGRLKNISSEPVHGFEIHVWNVFYDPGGNLRREEEYGDFENEPASSFARVLQPGEERPFTIPLQYVGDLEFPVAVSVGRAGDDLPPHPFRQRYGAQIHDGYP